MLKTITQVTVILIAASLAACGSASFSGESAPKQESREEEKPKRRKVTKERTSADASLGNQQEDTPNADAPDFVDNYQPQSVQEQTIFDAPVDQMQVVLTYPTACVNELYTTGVRDDLGVAYKVLSGKYGYYDATDACAYSGGQLIFNGQILPDSVQACSRALQGWARPSEFSLYQVDGVAEYDLDRQMPAICYYR